jgi:hypothetical protein
VGEIESIAFLSGSGACWLISALGGADEERFEGHSNTS